MKTCSKEFKFIEFVLYEKCSETLFYIPITKSRRRPFGHVYRFRCRPMLPFHSEKQYATVVVLPLYCFLKQNDRIIALLNVLNKDLARLNINLGLKSQDDLENTRIQAQDRRHWISPLKKESQKQPSWSAGNQTYVPATMESIFFGRRFTSITQSFRPAPIIISILNESLEVACFV